MHWYLLRVENCVVFVVGRLLCVMLRCVLVGVCWLLSVIVDVFVCFARSAVCCFVAVVYCLLLIVDCCVLCDDYCVLFAVRYHVWCVVWCLLSVVCFRV